MKEKEKKKERDSPNYFTQRISFSNNIVRYALLCNKFFFIWMNFIINSRQFSKSNFPSDLSAINILLPPDKFSSSKNLQTGHFSTSLGSLKSISLGIRKTVIAIYPRNDEKFRKKKLKDEKVSSHLFQNLHLLRIWIDPSTK